MPEPDARVVSRSSAPDPAASAPAVRLLDGGHDDFVILEKAPGIGGTWFHNRYPGAECDIKSHLYSFSFAPNPAWSRPYARQPEIKAYLEDVRRRASGSSRTCGSAPQVHAGAVGRRRRGVAADRRRRARSSTPTSWSSALGMFGAPVAPDIPGLDRFTGHDLPLRALGRRPRPHRRVGRGDRQRRQRGAAHPRDRADRRRAHRVPALGELGARRRRTTPFTDGAARRRSPPIPTRSPRCATRSSPPSIPTSPSTTRTRRAHGRGRRPPATSRWSRTPRCGASSPRTCRSGASDRWRRTSTTRRSTCRTSSW